MKLVIWMSKMTLLLWEQGLKKRLKVDKSISQNIETLKNHKKSVFLHFAGITCWDQWYSLINFAFGFIHYFQLVSF